MNRQPEKIQKVLAAAGICSRRSAEDLIRQGLVSVDGRVVDNPALRVDPLSQVLECRGQRVVPRSAGEASCLVLYKKAGYITSTADPHNKRTVYDLLPDQEREKQRWLYVGRLDKESLGLLLFTDSGELSHRLMHPSFKVEKHYRVTVAGRMEPSQLGPLVSGMEIEGKLMRMDSARITGSPGERTTSLEVVLHQGEKRQIRRMLGALGFRVISLVRTRFGPLTLKGLKPGECRRLTRAEIDSLVQDAGIRDGV